MQGAITNAYAGGRDFTVGKRENALVNELGNESIVSQNFAMTCSDA